MNLDHLIWPTEGWGFMPPQDDLFEAFKYVQEHYKPKRAFEIGFCWGHSTTYQLEIFKDASIVTIGPLAEPTLVKERPDPVVRKGQIEKMQEVYGKRFKHIAGRTQHLKDSLVRDYPNYFDYALIDGYHSKEAAARDAILCQDLNIPVVLVDNWDQRQVRRAVQAQKYKLVKEFYYEQTWKGKYRVNQIGLCTL